MLQGRLVGGRRPRGGGPALRHRRVPAGGHVQDLAGCPRRDPREPRRLEAGAPGGPRRRAAAMTWLLLTAGRGPAECRMAVAGLSRILLAEADEAGVEAELVAAETAPHGLMSALVALRGDGAETLARSWEGTVQWICPSPLRPGWARKNWFVGVSRLSPPPPSPDLSDRDLRIETMRSSGPGGQHVNTTESAVRITHLPTGTVALAREERSQHRNRALALARLAAALDGLEREADRVAGHRRWSRHDALERGNPVRIYVGERFTRRAP
ncbi:peptide chain release factor H [Skermanella sp. TT6]|uniref:Peptide chain release factor H n=2 Tax=Skermanella cutis TaxID=2775420 RepID=A0ABX7B6U0_9PROT|nr:peptide chain release factor H [Skermanella sp. TT6]